jgi:hypothetical protein
MSGSTPPDFTDLNNAMAELSAAADAAAAALAKAQTAATAVQGVVTPPPVVVTPPPVVVTPPPPFVPATPSPDGTVASALGQSVASGAGNTFALIAPSGIGRASMAIAFDGVEDKVTQGVASLLALGGKVYQVANNAWYVSNDHSGGWTWVSNGDPRNPPPVVVTPPPTPPVPPTPTPPTPTPPAPPGATSPFPRLWGAYGYPNPGPYGGGPCDQGASQSAGGQNIPFGSATSNLAFFARGGTANGKPWPGMGINISSHNCWSDFAGGDISFWQQGWASEGGPFARSSGLVPVQGVITNTRGGSMNAVTILTGAYDALIRGWVNGWTGVKELIIRPDWEWQINNTPTRLTDISQCPAQIKAWRYIYPIMHDEAAKCGIKLTICWNPVTLPWTFFPCSAAYPGDDACDAIALDLYACFGSLDNSPWSGFSKLVCGSADHLSGWQPGQMAANQMALAQSADAESAMWHMYDFPAGVASSPRGGSCIQANGAAKFGSEVGWGMIETIMFAKQHGKPVMFPEIGYCVDLNTPTTSGNPTWNVGLASCGIPDMNFARYLASRFAWAASLGVPIITANFNCYAPYNPYLCKGGSFGAGAAVGDCVQSISDAFAGTGTPMSGYKFPVAASTEYPSHSGRPARHVFRRSHHHTKAAGLAEHYRQMPH